GPAERLGPALVPHQLLHAVRLPSTEPRFGGGDAPGPLDLLPALHAGENNLLPLDVDAERLTAHLTGQIEKGFGIPLASPQCPRPARRAESADSGFNIPARWLMTCSLASSRTTSISRVGRARAADSGSSSSAPASAC